MTSWNVRLKQRQHPRDARRFTGGGWSGLPQPPAICLIALLALVAVSPALAQNPQPGAVVVECKPLSFQTRNGAPVVLDWTMTWTGRGILEGTLEIEARDEDNTRSILLGRFRVPGLIVANLPQSTRLMLPPLDVRGLLGQATLRGKFITEKFTFTLPDQVAFVPGPDKRAFSLAIPDPSDGGLSPGLTDLVQHGLAFERFDAAALDARIAAVTIPNWIALEDFPRDPLLLCSFDAVVLADDGLSQLRQEHLDAVRQWVEAGGAVLVRPGELIETRHVAFLNALVGLEGNPAGFRLDEDGKLAWPDGWDASAFKLHRQSLGRVVIAPRTSGQAQTVARATYDQPEWREAAWFLWRCRLAQRGTMRDDGKWRTEPALARYAPPGFDPGPFRPITFGVQPLQSGHWLLNRLIPESVELVPLWIIGCVLALFVLVVGPVDYFLLGLFRRRRLTWTLFPLVALAFAWFTVWLSNHYMQTSEQSGSLVLLDVGDRGRIVRLNELKLYFANTSRANMVEAQGELVAPIDHRRFGSLSQPGSSELKLHPDSGLYTDGRGNYYGDQEGDMQLENPESVRLTQLVAPPEYAGRAPTQYVISEWLPQWTPHLHRRFQIAPDGEFVEFDWRSISAAELSSAAGLKGLQNRLVAAFGDEVSVAVLHQDTHQVLVDGAELFTAIRAEATDAEETGKYDFLVELCVAPSAGAARQPFDRRAYDPAYVTPAMFAGGAQTGIFSLVSQIAPTGGDNFEDLALLDPTDDRQWLLLVGVRHNNDWHLYRKLYVGE